MCPSWSLGKIKSSAFKKFLPLWQYWQQLGGESPLLARSFLAGNLQAWVGVVCTFPCPCAHHTALQKCLHTAQCTLWRKVVIHYHCNTWLYRLGGKKCDNKEWDWLCCHDLLIDHIISIAHGMSISHTMIIAHGMSIAHSMSIAHTMIWYDMIWYYDYFEVWA